MPKSKWFYAVLAVAILGLGTFAFRSWLESHDDQLQLKTTLQAQQQLIDAANAQEMQHAAELQQALAQVDALKKSVRSPEEILRALPSYLHLPEPITMAAQQSTTASSGLQQAGSAAANPVQETGAPSSRSGTNEILPSNKGKGTPLPDSPSAQIPAADLKPLFDFVQDCRACQLKLAESQATLQDEQAKSQALTRERDAALKAAHGGSFWLRIRRNAKWLAIGAIAGSIASRRW
ncbi:MAG: hypothetical protein ACRD50_14165 [Candidatus Acidiferrales bacterium]